MFATFQIDVTNDGSNDKADPRTTIPTFLALYIFAFVYQLVLVWDALRLKNTIQIIGLVGLNVGLLLYGAVQMDQLHDAVNILIKNSEIEGDLWHATKPYLIAIPCILGFTTVCMAYVAYRLYKEFAWTIYKHISADLRMKRRYLTYQIYIALLKFDFFFTLGFTIQFVIIVGGRTNAERWVTVAAIPVTIVIMLAAFFFCRRENMFGTIVVIVLYFGGLAYFCFKLYRMYEGGDISKPYLPARKELTTFAVLTIFLLLGTIIVACMCTNNYGKGLMPYVRSGRVSRADRPLSKPFDSGSGYQHSQPNYMGHGPYSTEMSSDPYGGKNGRPLAPARMEID